MNILEKIDYYLGETLDLDAVARKQTKFAFDGLLKMSALSKILKLSVEEIFDAVKRFSHNNPSDSTAKELAAEYPLGKGLKVEGILHYNKWIMRYIWLHKTKKGNFSQFGDTIEIEFDPATGNITGAEWKPLTNF